LRVIGRTCTITTVPQRDELRTTIWILAELCDRLPAFRMRVMGRSGRARPPRASHSSILDAPRIPPLEPDAETGLAQALLAQLQVGRILPRRVERQADPDQISISIESPNARAGYDATLSGGGPSSTSPVRTSNSPAWHGQITVVPSSSPSDSEQARCVQVSPKA
jgi:hypothetical protein